MRLSLQRCFSIIIALSVGQVVYGQLSGYITTEEGSPLPYASVYIEGTTRGTTANQDGFYFLNLTPGVYTIVCEYMGYTPELKEIKIRDIGQELNFSLEKATVNLSEITVTSDRENPAYRIIRNARKNRKQNLRADMPQRCEMYMKGNIALEKTPETLMGKELPGKRELLDSVNSDILYLSETVSTIYRTENDIQEVVHSSRVSGSSMFSFNRGVMVEYSIYEGYIDSPFGKLVNPIGPVAFQYYGYKLLSMNYTEDGVNYKIQVISKNPAEPTVEGILYISDNGWKVTGFTLTSEGEKLNIAIIDSFTLQQEYISINGSEVLFKNKINFKFNLFGFIVNGFFLAVYNDYVFGEAARSDLNPRMAIEFQDSSQLHEDEYWKVIRPIQLTEKEKNDYHIKDSIAAIPESPEYRDSMTRLQNKYDVNNLLFGYTYNSLSGDFSFSHGSPLIGIGFDPIRGFSIPLKFSIEYLKHSLTIGGNYGFSDSRARYAFNYTYDINENKKQHLTLSVGSQLMDMNALEPMSRDINRFMNLFFRRNYIKFYNSEYYKFLYTQRLMPGLRWEIGGEYKIRENLQNNSDYSFFYKDREYPENVIIMEDFKPPENLSPELYRLNTEIDFFPGTEFIRYPDDVIRTFQTTYSVLTLAYDAAFPLFRSDISYHKIGLGYKRNIDCGILGNATLNTGGEVFLQKGQIGIQDLIWFRDNGSFFINSRDIEKRFLAMEPYSYYSSQYALEFHYYQDFNGYILNKIPLIRKLGFTLAAKVSSLYTPEQGNYSEISLGIDRIGWYIFRPLRFDVVFPVENFHFQKPQYVIGLQFFLGNMVE